MSLPYLKPIICKVLFTFIIFTFGCKVYYKQSISLYQATDIGKIKIINKNGDVVLADRLIKENENFYIIRKQRVKENDGKYVWTAKKTPIETSQIAEIYLYNKSSSRGITTIVTVTTTLVLIYLFAI